MSAIGYRLFKGNRVVHFAFILYRLKRDFGFTDFEIANFTGIPMSTIQGEMALVKPFLETEVLKMLVKLDKKELLHEWREMSDGKGGMQGYYVVKEEEPWHKPRIKNGKLANEDKHRKTIDWSAPLEFSGELGKDSLNEYNEKIKDLYEDYIKLKTLFERDPSLEERLSRGSSQKLKELELPKQLVEDWEIETLEVL